MSKEAATPVEGEQKVEQTTTEKLFPDLVKSATPLPAQENAQVEGAEIKPEVQPPVATEPQTVDYLDSQAMSKKVKTKVDGIEGEATIEELIRGYQTAQHLSRIGQKIGEERRAIREEIGRLEQLRQPATQAEQPQAGQYDEIVMPYITPVIQENMRLRQAVDSLSVSLQPLAYQQNLDKIDADLKKDGKTDFKTYLPQIEAKILSMPQEQAVMYDTEIGFKLLYQEMKMNDLAKKPSIPDVRPKAPIVPIESATQPTNTTTKSALVKEYNEAVRRAKESSSSEDWGRVIQLKEEMAKSA